MIEGCDYSFARPGGAALKAAGKAFAVRYVPYDGAGGKGLTSDELTDLHNNGIAVVMNFESTANRVLSGADAGRQDALVSRQKMTELGFSADRPVYFSVDFEASLDNQPAIDAYLRAAGDVLGANRVGVYACYDVIVRCQQSGSAHWFWQTYAWSSGRVAPNIHLYQYKNSQDINGAVDFDQAYTADYGAWLQGGAKDMDIALIINAIYNVYAGRNATDAEIQEKAGYINNNPGRLMQVMKDVFNAGVDQSEVANTWALTTYDAARGDSDPGGYAWARWAGGDNFKKVINNDIASYFGTIKSLQEAQSAPAAAQPALAPVATPSAADKAVQALKEALGEVSSNG